MPDSTAGARREDEVLPALPSPTKGVLGFGKIQEHLTLECQRPRSMLSTRRARTQRHHGRWSCLARTMARQKCEASNKRKKVNGSAGRHGRHGRHVPTKCINESCSHSYQERDMRKKYNLLRFPTEDVGGFREICRQHFHRL